MVRRALLLLASCLFATVGCNDDSVDVAPCAAEATCYDGSEPPPPPPAPGLDGCNGEDISKQTPYERILYCRECSPDWSFTLSGVPVCGVPEPPSLNPQEPTPVPAEPPELDLVKFEAYMRRRDGDTVGYAWALVDTRPGYPRLAASGAFGIARPGAAGATRGESMKTSTPANVGSVAKMLGGISLLYVYEHLTPAQNPQGISLERFLATPFLYFLPMPAKKFADPSLASITIGSLLQHRSGLRLDTSLQPAQDLKNLLQQKINPADQVREYNNMNLLIARYLITFLANENARVELEKNPNISIDELSAEVDKKTRLYYAAFLNTTLKDVVGDNFTATCFAAETPGAAYMFDNAVDRNAHIYSSKDWGGCSTQGGIWVSVEDLARFFAAYRNNKLISERTRRIMSNRADLNGVPGDGRLVWASYDNPGNGTRSPWLKDNFQVGSFFGHGGDHPREVDGIEYHAHAAVIELLWGYYGIAIVNSREMGSGTLMMQLKNAFAAALGWQD
mgnify:CR=1 FL=1